MDAPRDYHTKWSQKEKDKHHITPLICEIWDMTQMKLLRNRLTNIENKLVDAEAEESCGEGWSGSLGLADETCYT